MCKFFNCLPDDDIIENLDPAVRLWMFYNWVEDQNDDVELVKNHAYLIGSFINPEAVSKLTGGAGTQKHISTDEEFEASTRMINDKPIESQKKVRRRRIKG